MNLLTETLEKMTAHDQSPATVAWVGACDGTYAGTWDDFAAIADFEYDDGYGGNEIELGLVVVFRDGSWLERHEYDGSEWWEYKTTPTQGWEPLTNNEQLIHDYARGLRSSGY